MYTSAVDGSDYETYDSSDGSGDEIFFDEDLEGGTADIEAYGASEQDSSTTTVSEVVVTGPSPPPGLDMASWEWSDMEALQYNLELQERAEEDAKSLEAIADALADIGHWTDDPVLEYAADLVKEFEHMNEIQAENNIIALQNRIAETEEQIAAGTY